MNKYTVQQLPVNTLLSWVRSGQVAIPEMQRPFVWNSTKVRDLMDSLYQGFPIGYLITWQSVEVGLKDGSTAGHKQILIDGQQRITAMTAALAGERVVDKSYKKVRVTIAFNPIAEEFATLTPVMKRQPEWYPDIAEFFAPGVSKFSIISDYMRANPDSDTKQIERAFNTLDNVVNAQVGVITLADDLDIETVTEIFVRINSKGVALSNADFAMSKISSHGHQGANLRKYIDYFCHLAVAPHMYDEIQSNDAAFADSGYLNRIAWLKDDAEDLFDPDYTDVIRIAGLRGFARGKMSAVVSRLSGRDPETRKFDEQIAVNAFSTLEATLHELTNRYAFSQFVSTIKSAGFIVPGMITSKNALNFAYALQLRLKASGMADGEIKRMVRRWFVMSLLTGRASGSFETTWEQDIRRIDELGSARHLELIESSLLSDAFWAVTLPESLKTPTHRTPAFHSFMAAQIYSRDRGFLSDAITVATMHENGGDIHHVMPKDYLVKNGYSDRGQYNQVANFVLAETPVNIGISNKSPKVYMSIVRGQIASGHVKIGAIRDEEQLRRNLDENAIPVSIFDLEADGYEAFLDERRILMADKIRRYYESL